MRRKPHVRLLWLAFLDDINVVNHPLVVALRSYIRGIVVDNFGHLSLLALSSEMPSLKRIQCQIQTAIIACLKTKSLFGLSIYTKYYNKGDT